VLTADTPWTYDLGIAPSSVYGLAALNWYGQGGSSSAAIVGFLSYWTQDPDTGVPSEHVTSGLGGNIYGPGWLAPVILDENVIIISCAWNCFADSWVEALGSFTVFIGLD
jgi:hypothetical protein